MVRSGTNSAARPLRTGRVGRLLLGLLCVIAPILAADARGTQPAHAVATRFSSLSELTPRNVRDLMPLAALPVEIGNSDVAGATDPAGPSRATRLGSLAAGDERLREFVSWRVALTGGASVGSRSLDSRVAVSLVAAPAAAAEQGVALAAWDESRARLVWAAGKPAAQESGALVTAGGLILYCSADGWLNVLDVTTGRELWRHRVSGGERGTPISYLGPDGHQFVAVLSERHGHRPTLQPFSLPR